jgi:putative hydrolase of the HAD superfamily
VNDLPAGILIDLDDTILDDSGCVEACWADACSEAARRVPGLDAVALGREIATYVNWWWSDAERTRIGRLDLQAATRKIVTETMRRMGVADAKIAADVAILYRALRDQRSRLFEGAIETLEELRTRGVRLGLMTNGAATPQRAKIERFGLAHHFEHIVIEGEFGAGKPDPRVFASLLQALRVEPHETWAVGDNLSADVFGAMDAGIFGIWVDPANHGLPADAARRPDRVIASIRELISPNGSH